MLIIYILCLCPLRLAVMLNFNISKKPVCLLLGAAHDIAHDVVVEISHARLVT